MKSRPFWVKVWDCGQKQKTKNYFSTLLPKFLFLFLFVQDKTLLTYLGCSFWVEQLVDLNKPKNRLHHSYSVISPFQPNQQEMLGPPSKCAAKCRRILVLANFSSNQINSGRTNLSPFSLSESSKEEEMLPSNNSCDRGGDYWRDNLFLSAKGQLSADSIPHSIPHSWVLITATCFVY